MVERSPRQLRLFGNRLRPNRDQRERGKRWIELARRQLDAAEARRAKRAENDRESPRQSDEAPQ